MKKLVLSIILAFTLAIISSCSNNDVANISQNNISESHNMGRNCMQCHTSGGNGKGIFKAAGTIYNTALTSTNPNGKVLLYTQPDSTGKLVATLYVDAKGNFYTTDAISFVGGLYPVIVSTSGNKKYMPDPAFSGECNSCHNVSNKKLFVD